jgi:hypothetical protein
VFLTIPLEDPSDIDHRHSCVSELYHTPFIFLALFLASFVCTWGRASLAEVSKVPRSEPVPDPVPVPVPVLSYWEWLSITLNGSEVL